MSAYELHLVRMLSLVTLLRDLCGCVTSALTFLDLPLARFMFM